MGLDGVEEVIDRHWTGKRVRLLVMIFDDDDCGCFKCDETEVEPHGDSRV